MALAQQQHAPGSTCTSRIFFSVVVFCPLHALQRSLSFTISPSPRHAGHTD